MALINGNVWQVLQDIIAEHGGLYDEDRRGDEGQTWGRS